MKNMENLVQGSTSLLGNEINEKKKRERYKQHAQNLGDLLERQKIEKNVKLKKYLLTSSLLSPKDHLLTRVYNSHVRTIY